MEHDSSETGLGGSCCLREPVRADGWALYSLIRSCPPLDVNSAYAYFLVCDHYRTTTILATQAEALNGCVTAYRRPDARDTLFVWQVAVRAEARGQGLGHRMLDALLCRPAVQGVKWIETTISPSNVASRRLFGSWAVAQGVRMEETAYLEPDDFGDSGHEAERLMRLGPFPEGPDPGR